MSLVIIGSAAFDSIETPKGRREKVLGGSGVYASVAASLTGEEVQLVGVVGGDWPESNTRLLESRGIDTRGLEIRPDAETLYWSGRYFENMNDRETLEIKLGVMGTEYDPIVPEEYRKSKFVFLANGSPQCHLALLRQMERTSLIIADTMDFYINNCRQALLELLTKIDGLILNDSESRLLTGEANPLTAARKIQQMGPQFVIIKKGEHGAIMVTPEGTFLQPAYPLENVVDPTGAGDSFAGAFVARLASAEKTGLETIKEALAWATVTASFNVEGFSLERLLEITRDDIEQRRDRFREMIVF